jgi:hypothetical protein
MGWDFFQPSVHKPLREIMDAQFTWHDNGMANKVLASVMVGSTYYAAVEVRDKVHATSKVRAVVALTQRKRSRENGLEIGFKAMDESEGPVKSDCPARILDMLTDAPNDYARAWRNRCRANAGQVLPSEA